MSDNQSFRQWADAVGFLMIKEIRFETAMRYCAHCNGTGIGKTECCGHSDFYDVPVTDTITGEYAQMLDELSKKGDGRQHEAAPDRGRGVDGAPGRGDGDDGVAPGSAEKS